MHKGVWNMATRITVSRGGEEMRALRRRLGWTQAKLAGMLGTHRDTLGAWERGKCEPPVMAIRLTRYMALALPPPSVFIATPVVPTIPFIQVSPGTQCYWQQADGVPCGGRQFHVQARLSRRRDVESQTCEAHLNTIFEKMVTTLEEFAKAEQRRQAGRWRQRLARQRARENLAASVVTAPTT
jgi:DNA-binding XRE family transcriptional regulator